MYQLIVCCHADAAQKGRGSTGPLRSLLETGWRLQHAPKSVRSRSTEGELRYMSKALICSLRCSTVAGIVTVRNLMASAALCRLIGRHTASTHQITRSRGAYLHAMLNAVRPLLSVLSSAALFLSSISHAVALSERHATMSGV